MSGFDHLLKHEIMNIYKWANQIHDYENTNQWNVRYTDKL